MLKIRIFALRFRSLKNKTKIAYDKALTGDGDAQLNCFGFGKMLFKRSIEIVQFSIDWSLNN